MRSDMSVRTHLIDKHLEITIILVLPRLSAFDWVVHIIHTLDQRLQTAVISDIIWLQLTVTSCF